MALGVSGAYFAKGITFANAPGRGHVVKMVSTQGPDAVERNLQFQRALGAASLTDRNSGNSQSDAVAPKDSRTGPQIAP